MTTPLNLNKKKPFDEEVINNFVSKVGERVRHARQQKAISRRILSEKSGVSQRYLAQLETGGGNISVGLLYQVAAALGHSPDWFLGEDDPWDSDLYEFSQLFRQADQNQKKRALEELRPATASVNKGRRICLIGLRGAGKSTLGRLLADVLSIEFMELNKIIENQSGMPVSEVIALYGQEGYRQLERKALDTVFENNDSVVLAVGGGIVSEQETYTHLLRTFHTVWLKASPEEHMDRVREQGDVRPMAGNPKAMEELRSILTSRENLYARADSMIDTSNRTIDESTEDLVEAISNMIKR